MHLHVEKNYNNGNIFCKAKKQGFLWCNCMSKNRMDMDVKVKAMLKLIEEDADSFARRAEMYYKKRPELIKLVEEFYRAYRALAERYDHATGALRQAHRTIAEAFPNQIPLVLTDDSPIGSSAAETEPRTPEMAHPIRAIFDPDDLQKDALGVSSHFHGIKRNGAYSEDNVSVTGKIGLKQLNEMLASGDSTNHARFAEGKVRKGLKFQGDEKKGIDNLAFNAFMDIHKQNVAEIDDTASKTRSLQDELSQLSTTNYNLKIKVESESCRADQAKDEVESLQKILSELESEKEAVVLQYQQCLERVSRLEAEISRRQADVNRLDGEIVDGATRLNATEERLHLLEKENQSLQAEVDSLAHKATIQQQEIQHKNGELQKLGNCIEEERMHLMHAEGALQSFQSLQSQSQEEQKILAWELQHGVQMLKDMEFRRQGLEEELQQLIGENNQLNEQNLSSAMSIKSLQDEIYTLREAKERLEEEVMLRVNERNALQQKLYCLKEELNDLDRKHRAVIVQVESVGFDASSLRSSIEKLQDESRKLKELCKDNEHEKAVLFEKLENMDRLIEKNALLENSLSDASVELEGLRERLSILEKSLQSLEEEKLTLASEKSVLISHVLNMTQNMEKLTEKNSILENSLSDMHSELDGLQAKAQSLQESCQVLQDEKSSLLMERSDLVSQVETVRQCLDHLEMKHAELKYKHSCLEKERESALRSMNELQHSLDIEKQERATYILSSQTQLDTLENQLNLLQKESEWRKLQLEEGQDNMVNAEIQIFVLQRSIQDIRAKNLSLSMECLIHIEASVCAKKLILELEQEMLEQKIMTNSLLEKNKKLRTGVYCVLKSLDIDMSNQLIDGDVGEDLFPLILGKVKAMHKSIMDMEDEKHQLLFEKIVSAALLEQLRLDALDLKSAKHAIEWEFASKAKEVLVLQNEKYELLELSDHLRQDVYDTAQKVELLTDQVEHLQVQLSDSRECYWALQKNMHEENQALKEEINGLRVENHILEEENDGALEEVTNLGYLSLVFGSICSDKVIELMRLSKELDHLHKVSCELEEVSLMAEKLEAENYSLKDLIATLEKFRSQALCLEDELQTIRVAREQLNHEIDVGKNLLSQREIELLQACQKVKALEYERAELIDEVLGLRLKNEQLSSMLHEKGNEVELWEEEATALYEHLQISSFCLALFEENAGKLISHCRNIEENAKIQQAKFHDDRTKSSADNEELKEKICALENENGGLKAELTSFMPLILSLKDSISSLEAQTLSLAKLHEIDSQETQDVAENHVLHIDGNQTGPAYESTSLAGEELLQLQTQVQAAEKAVMEMGRVAMQRSSNNNARLEAALKEMEELKSKISLVQEDIVHSSKDVIHQADILRQADKKCPNGIEQQEPEVSIAKHGLLMKDIQLDHVSETSSLENGTNAGGIGKRGKSKGGEDMLELLETAERDCRVEPLGINKMDKLISPVFDDVIEYHEIEPVEEQKSEYPSSELQIEKELAIDKLEVPKGVLEPRPDGNSRVLERLASDALRLANLQSSAQELKRRFEKFEKVNQLVGFEYDTVKQQLKEVNEAISQLVNNDGRLTKSVEIIYASDSKSKDFEDARSMRRRQVSQRARRWSEKIGRLELEVQRIQFVMLKLENEWQNKGMRAFDRRKKVVLRDYLYGVRESRRRKKVHLCACVRPSTKSD